MSTEAMTWVVEDAPDLPSHLIPTLLGLANHVDKRGQGAYPSQELLSEYARKSDRAVRNDLEALLKEGLIRLGDQSLAEHLPSDRRPVVYDLAVERKRERIDRKPTSGRTGRKPTSGRSEKPRSETNDRKPASARSNDRKPTSGRTITEEQRPSSEAFDRKPTSGRSAKNGRKPSTGPGGSPLPTNRPYEPSLFVLKEHAPGEQQPEPPADPFEDFYAAYPRKVAKGRARTAWAAALKRGQAAPDLIAVASRFAAHTRLCKTEQRWIPHPATWLNDERYDDYIPTPDEARHLAAVPGGHVPYQNPTDQSEYDEGI